MNELQETYLRISLLCKDIDSGYPKEQHHSARVSPQHPALGTPGERFHLFVSGDAQVPPT